MKSFDSAEIYDVKRGRFAGFHELMRYRIRDILLVSSQYDAFVLGEEVGLYELLLGEYMGLNLSQTPGVTRVAGGREALALAREEKRFDLIIVTLHLEDMAVLEFARNLRQAGVDTPLVLLTYDNRELNDLMANHDLSCFDRVFMWQGNFRILLAIIKCIEDHRNVARDTRLAGVQSVILIEDSVKFYSSYLPIIYTQLMRHSQDVIDEGFNITHKMLRMRARPKILLCHTYEEAWNLYEEYDDAILGVISDIQFPKDGQSDPMAGITLARNVKRRHPDIPILLQSNDINMASSAYRSGASFLLKNSPRLLHELQSFMRQHFSFGDFIFYLPDRTEVGRAKDLRELEDTLRTVPDESLVYHAERNHFSNWLKARTEFQLAYQLRPQKVGDYPTTSELRESIINALKSYRITLHRGRIIDFHPAAFDPLEEFACIGGGSLGGKGRGLVFLSTLLNQSHLPERFDELELAVPPTLFLKTDVFDQFMELNDLTAFAMASTDDARLVRRFLEAEMPPATTAMLSEYLKVMDCPLAVRSSSLLEDSQYQPFAGIYETYMVPNNHQDFEIRLTELLCAIKRVYASTYSQRARAYIKATPYRLEEEKMAVVLQRIAGRSHDRRFYPDFSGVARSYNFYPIQPMTSDDGIASVALGFGRTVVEGGLTTRFCPTYPRHTIQFSTLTDALNSSQKAFYALDMPDPAEPCDPRRKMDLMQWDLQTAEEDDVLGPLASTYSPENEALYDGTSRVGHRVLTFAPILKSDFFPLAEVLQEVLKLGQKGMSGPVELEFSVNMSVPYGQPKEFHLLQLRPMVKKHEQEQLELGEIKRENLICQSRQIMGHGMIDDIHDIVFVDWNRFDRARTVEVAAEIGLFNLELEAEGRPYLLIGIGRWGSADPWLGIPVEWENITGARTIVETDFKDMKVTPSQGTHFFQNLHAFEIGYFTINSDSVANYIDWEWLCKQPAHKERTFSRHLRFDSPLVVKMNGHTGVGVVLKPQKG